MSTKKAIGISFVAIFILIIAQIIAQVIASVFVIIKIPYGICNIIAGIIYVGLTYLILKMFISKIVKLLVSDFGMPKFENKIDFNSYIIALHYKRNLCFNIQL